MSQTPETPVSIVRRPVRGKDWAELVASIRVHTCWSDETQVYAYFESPRDCALKRPALRVAAPPDDAWEGRLFEDPWDVRWVRSEDGRLSAWLTGEVAGGEPLSRLDRRYYLLGIRDSSSSGGEVEFWESRYPDRRVAGRRFRYPIRQQPSEAKARAYILVAEYAPVMPAWSGKTTEAVEAALNAGRVVAHRFLHVAVGTDPKKNTGRS